LAADTNLIYTDLRQWLDPVLSVSSVAKILII